jgi:hypothetical protein
VFWDINFGVTDPSVTPFGFDVVPNAPDPVAGTIIEVVSGTGSSNPVKQVGVGIRQTGFSTSSYATERTAGVTKPGLIGAVFNWSDWQPVSWNAYDNTALTGFDALVDFCKTETVAGRAVKIILRMIQPPLGGPNKTNTGNLPDWMVGVADSLNNSRPVPFWDKIDTDGGAHVARVATNWNADFTYNGNYVYHYQNAMQQMNGYLNGTTSTGNRRADFVHFVPVLGPTDTGSEMPIDMGSGSASFNPPVTVGGVVYGNDANGAPSIPDISIVNRRTAQLLMPASVVADTQTAQDTWLSNWWHNMSSVVLGGAGGLAQGNGSWMQCIAIHLAQSNFDSSVAYGSIMADGYARARDILTRNAAFLKTRLWTMQTNLRVRPPGGDYSRPISEWTYANWSANAAGHFLLAIQISSPGIPLIFMQTAASTGVGGSRGTPPSDFQRAVEDGITTYKAQGIETYTGVFTDATYGATNAAYANTANGIMQTTANQVATGGVTRGELHIKEVVAVTNGPIGRRNLPANTSDAWFRFVVDSITAPSATVTLHLSKSSGTTGDLAVRLDSTKHLIGRWSGGAVDWTDTNVLQSGDVVDIHHVLNGATSGYEIWVNGTQRRKNLALSAVAASVITYGQIGLANAADVEAWYYRYGAASTRMGTPTSGATNGDSPVVQIISPTDSQVFTSGGTKPVTVTAFDNDGLSAVEVRVDGGAWQAMTASGSQYTANVSLSGTAGQSLAHVIDVRATDAYSVVAQRLITIVSVTALVNVPGADTTLPTLTVTNPASNISVANAVDTQTVTGVATDNVAVTQCTVNSVAQTLDASGNFTTTIPLIVGANTITVQAKDAAGNTSTVTRTVTRQDVIVVSPPTVTITSPSAGQTFPKGTRALTLAGTASDPVALQSVTYNVDGSGEVSLTVSGGAFSSQIGITPGNHTITVTATNNASLRDTDTRNIFVALDDIVASGGETTGLQKGRVIVRA